MFTFHSSLIFFFYGRHQILQHGVQENAQAIKDLEKQVGQIAAILSERNGEIFPSESKSNPIERDVFHEENHAYTTLRSEKDFNNELSELVVDEEKKEYSMLEGHLHYMTSQITTNKKSIP
ncbi:unnamed protein product [Malus baccata var. baccata]